MKILIHLVAVSIVAVLANGRAVALAAYFAGALLTEIIINDARK